MIGTESLGGIDCWHRRCDLMTGATMEDDASEWNGAGRCKRGPGEMGTAEMKARARRLRRGGLGMERRRRWSDEIMGDRIWLGDDDPGRGAGIR